MSTIVKHVVIDKLWDYKSISIDMYEDVNILIGSNGTSKTTVLRIIEAILKVELLEIDEIYFEKAMITLQENSIEHNVSVMRIQIDGVSYIYRYQIDDEDSIDISYQELRSPYMRIRQSSRKTMSYLRDRITQLVNISWLSITRLDDFEDRRSDDIDVDRKLSKLMRETVSYRLELETMVNLRTKKFNEDVVSLLLYNEQIDTLPDLKMYSVIDEFSEEDLRQELHRVFSYFGNPRNHTDDIDKHVRRIQSLKRIMRNERGFDGNDLLSFSLLNRTTKILTLSKAYQNDRSEIMEPFKKYIEIVGNFIKDKEFSFSDKGELMIKLKRSAKDVLPLLMKSLSSGEKQLLILLTETLLQRKTNYVFIADEPELSLHIEWQRNLIKSIRELNPNAQILFATHAPEIAANFPKKLILMERVTKYE